MNLMLTLSVHRDMRPRLEIKAHSCQADRNRELPLPGRWYAIPKSSCWMKLRQP